MRVLIAVLVLWLAGLGAAAQFGKLSFSLDLIAARYPLAGPVALGLVLSVVGLVGLVFGTTAGLLVARIGPRRALTAALALGAGLSALQSLPLPYGLMMLSRVLEGVSHLAIVVVGPVLIAGITPPRHQGLAMTLWSSFFGVTYAGLALLAPALLRHGLPGLFMPHAALMLALALVLGRLLPADPPPPKRDRQGGLLRQHLEIYASPRLAAPALGFVNYTAIYVAALTLLPPALPGAQVGLLAVGMPLISILASLTLGVWALRRMAAVRLVQAGFGLGGVAAVGLWWVWGHDGGLGAAKDGAMLVLGLVFAAAMGIVQGASFASIPELNATAEDRARAAGAVAQLGNLGTTTGTPILAFLLAQWGGTGFLVFALPLCLSGIGIHAWQARRRGG